MAVRSSRGVIVRSLLLCLVVVGPELTVRAQGRFELLTHDVISQVPGLSIYTIRDKQRSVCYALFTMERSASGQPAPLAVPSPPPPPPPADLQSPPSISQSRDAARPAGDRAPAASQWATLPWTTPTPGMPTGGWEYLAESMRRALVDPTTAKALAEPLDGKLTGLDQRLGRIELLLQNTGASPRFAVWPVSCESTGKK